MTPSTALYDDDARLEKLVYSLRGITGHLWLLSARAFKISFLAALILDKENAIQNRALAWKPGVIAYGPLELVRKLEEDMRFLHPSHGELRRRHRHAVLRRIFVLSMELLEAVKKQRRAVAAN